LVACENEVGLPEFHHKFKKKKCLKRTAKLFLNYTKMGAGGGIKIKIFAVETILSIAQY
jgi:hypothetical protein